MKIISTIKFFSLFLIYGYALGLTRIGETTDEALNFIKSYLPENPVIVEAGAYDGIDTIKMSKIWSKGHLYSFEPVPSIFNTLQSNTSSLNNVTCYPYALSDKNGYATFYVSEYVYNQGSPSASSSLLPPQALADYEKSLLFNIKIEVPTITLEEWAKKYNVSKIDMLWLDMQGTELIMLKKAGKILNTVKLIYIEVEFIEAYKDQPLYNDVKAWLQQEGFTLLATDFDEAHAALGKNIPIGQRYYGNAIFIRK